MDDLLQQMREAGPVIQVISFQRLKSAGRATCTTGRHTIPAGMTYCKVAEIADGEFRWWTECERCEGCM